MSIALDDLLLFSVLTFSVVFVYDQLVFVKTTYDSIGSPRAVGTPGKRSGMSPRGISNLSIDSSSSLKSIESRKGVDIPAQKTRVLPFLPGCEPNGPAAREMIDKYPDTPVEDIVRYLVARKGNVAAASEMLEKYVAWREEYFPLQKADVGGIYRSNFLFHHGVARDGTPVIYCRGGMYDKTLGSPYMHVLAAAHCMDDALKNSESINVTVMLHTGHAEGGPNAPADMNFIKAFVAVLSDNYPERLKRLILYPFPWWGRTIWNMVSLFLDKRTADKVVLLSGDLKGPPPKELFEYVAASEIPISCGGIDGRPTPDMVSTLVR
jgi:hypothetical protein